MFSLSRGFSFYPLIITEILKVSAVSKEVRIAFASQPCGEERARITAERRTQTKEAAGPEQATRLVSGWPGTLTKVPWNLILKACPILEYILPHTPLQERRVLRKRYTVFVQSVF